MNNEDIKKLIAERFDNLQKEIQDLIMSKKYEDILVNISKDFNLKEEEIKNLDLNTILVLLGEIHPNDYKKSLMEDLNLEKEKLNTIVDRVEGEILKDIKSLIIKNWEKEDEEEKNFYNIPIPPYAKKESVQENINKEKNIFEETGINMVEEKKIIEPTNAIEDKFSIDEDRDLVNSGISLIEEENKIEKEHLLPNLETQKSVVKGIENPPTQNNNLIDQKLNSVFTSHQNTNNANIPPVNKDPYRENI